MIPNRVHNRYIVLLSLVVQTIMVYAQDCYPLDAIYRPEEHTLDRVYYAQIKDVLSSDSAYVLRLDTSAYQTVKEVYTTAKKTCIVNTAGDTVIFISESGDSTILSEIRAIQTIASSEAICLFAIDYHKRRLTRNLLIVQDSVAGMQTLTVPEGYFVGKNDTSLFFVSKRFKWNKKWYPEGTLFYINTSGIHVMDNPELTQLITSGPIYPMHYYAAPYFVQYNGYTTETFQCNTLDRSSYLIWYNQQVVDTIQVLNNYTTPLSVNITGDTLRLMYYAYTEDGLNTHGFERVYVSGNQVYNWDHNRLKEPIKGFSFYTRVGKYVVIRYTRFIPFLQDEITYTSENGITLNARGYMPVFLLYQIDTQAFLGYPRLQVDENP